jgi:hypothetical protein
MTKKFKFMKQRPTRATFCGVTTPRSFGFLLIKADREPSPTLLTP